MGDIQSSISGSMDLCDTVREVDCLAFLSNVGLSCPALSISNSKSLRNARPCVSKDFIGSVESLGTT